MKKQILSVFFILPLFACAQQQPVPVESPSILESGYARTEFGVAHFFQQSFPLSGLKGNLYKLGTICFKISLNKYVELQTDGTLLDVLSIKERKPAFNSAITTTNNPTADIGDFSLWTKFALLNEYSSGLAFSVRFGVQLPNASNESGLGIDEMNFYSALLFQKHFLGKWTLNVGLGILGDPTQLSSQHDVCIYGIEYFLPVAATTSIVLQTAGRTGHDGVGVNRLANGKLGIEKNWENFSLKTFGTINFSPTDNAKGAEVSLSYFFQVLDTTK